ncbi:MAG TPA: transcription-repair coupling factor [Pyrinomonadaceae bacterium]|nr:transcription-repair coupling factor [Pyrinomonadaceae bacterium]
MADVFEQLKKAVRSETKIVSLSGLTSGPATAYVLARLHAEAGAKLAIVTETNADLDTWAGDIRFFCQMFGKSDQEILTLPSFESRPYSGVSPHAETQEKRALTLWQLARATGDIVLLSARSMAQRTVTPREMSELGCEIRIGQEIPPEELVGRLIAGGYIREEPIFGPGQFSIRGGIIDAWSPTGDRPLRIEFFGDTVESIREFEADTQLSVTRIGQASLAPMRELTATKQDLKDWAFFAADRFSDEKFWRNLRDRTDLAAEGETFSGWEFLLPLVRPMNGSVFDYLKDHLLVVVEPAAVELSLATLFADLERDHEAIVEAGDIGLEPGELLHFPDHLRRKLNELQTIEIRALGRSAAATDEEFQLATDGASMGTSASTLISSLRPSTRGGRPGMPLFLFPTASRATEIEILSRPVRSFHGDVQAFTREVLPTDIVVAQTPGMADRLAEMLREYDITLPPNSIVIGPLSAGFEIPTAEVRLYSEMDIFGESSAEGQADVRPKPAQRSRLAAFTSDFRDLKPGDFVVHVDHGIGRFEGLETISSQGSEREFMLLVYADNAKLFVPVERMDLVSRYSSGEATSPTLDRLGGIGWQKTKAKAKRAMRDMADELLKLYAERKLVRGHAFSADAPWQHEFEDAFPYELTADQAAAIADVKHDMETPVPMDRLIIGDVGYGKTEVAMRAAFKAVMDGKQAAILAPTTVLAYQHFETFRKRFAAFPVKVDLLSRFRSSKEQKAVAEAVGKGEVDVLIGTHRLLSSDVKLPNVGIVVVDEEQRFGVGHKEKLKQMKKKVDVLTLSATPIPRTLNMSLLGMRDMSVIETPPRDRLAINTQVVQFSEGVIRSAIELELSRHGQVFFIHNRVESIESIAALIQKIVPTSRIAIGHGQMNEKEMEQVMLDFIDYKYDVLVATTIIENGIDIPRANTIIINRADNYGLSQLYQLRGRVGRSNKRAYAYLLIPSELELTPIARRRLSAIREFSDLGAGFRLAALDLELRGAGNILGGQQSGHLDALGFDLYTKMLERTIAEIRGEDVADDVSVSINLGIDVSIPKDYMAEASQRLRTYKRISSAQGEEDLVRIHAEIEDRYGRIPPQVENLFEYGRLRKIADEMRILSIDRSRDGIAIKLSEDARISPDKLLEYLSENPDARFSPSGVLRIPDDPDHRIIAVKDCLERIAL